MEKIKTDLTILVFIFLAATVGHAQTRVEECSEVLNQRSLWTDDFRKNTTIQLIVHSRFLRSDFASATVDTNAGFGVSTGVSVLGGPFDENRYSSRKEYLTSALVNFAVPARREIDAALAAGLPSLVSAWKNCARSKRGLTIRFEPQSPRDAIAYIEFFGSTGEETKVLGDANLPTGVTAVTGGDCLRSGKIIKVGEPCIMVLSLPDATATLLLALNSDAGLAMGFLPGRVKLSSQTRPFRFTPNCNASDAESSRCADRLWKSVAGKRETVSHRIQLPQDLPADMAGQGWEFLNSSAKIEIVLLARYSPSNTSWCQDPVVDAKSTTFRYGYTLRAGIEHHQPATLTCMVNPSIELSRPIWIPEN